MGIYYRQLLGIRRLPLKTLRLLTSTKTAGKIAGAYHLAGRYKQPFGSKALNLAQQHRGRDIVLHMMLKTVLLVAIPLKLQHRAVVQRPLRLLKSAHIVTFPGSSLRMPSPGS